MRDSDWIVHVLRARVIFSVYEIHSTASPAVLVHTRMDCFHIIGSIILPCVHCSRPSMRWAPRSHPRREEL
jgi:hypothetical protein